MSKNKVMLGLLAGAAAGAIAGILLAPDKGTVTRKNIAKKGRDTVDNLKGQVNDLVEKVADNYFPGSENESGAGTKNSRSTAGQQNSPGSPTRSFT